MKQILFLFKDTHTLKSWINYEDQRCIALFIRELFNLRKELLGNNMQKITESQLITSFFQPPEATTKKHQGDHKDITRSTCHRLQQIPSTTTSNSYITHFFLAYILYIICHIVYYFSYFIFSRAALDTPIALYMSYFIIPLTFFGH